MTQRKKTPRIDPAEEAIRKRTIWQSYAVLPAQTRLKISLGICAVALAGIFISDRLEESVPAPPGSAPRSGTSKSS